MWDGGFGQAWVVASCSPHSSNHLVPWDVSPDFAQAFLISNFFKRREGMGWGMLVVGWYGCRLPWNPSCDVGSHAERAFGWILQVVR